MRAMWPGLELAFTDRATARATLAIAPGDTTTAVVAATIAVEVIVVTRVAMADAAAMPDRTAVVAARPILTEVIAEVIVVAAVEADVEADVATVIAAALRRFVAKAAARRVRTTSVRMSGDRQLMISRLLRRHQRK